MIMCNMDYLKHIEAQINEPDQLNREKVLLEMKNTKKQVKIAASSHHHLP